MKEKITLYVLDGQDEEYYVQNYTTDEKEADSFKKEMEADGMTVEVSTYGFSREDVETALYEKIFGELRG